MTPAARDSPPPGWYSDPSDEHARERYWDGSNWTKRKRWPSEVPIARRLERRGAERPGWYARPSFAIAYLGVAVLLSVAAGTWVVAAAMVALLVVHYLVLTYAPWVYFLD